MDTLFSFEEARRVLNVSLDDAPLGDALRHASVNEASGVRLVANGNLAFVGDAVLELIVRAREYQGNATASLGELSRGADEIVRNSRVAELARAVHLGRFVVVGKSRERDVNEHQKILSDSFEAILGQLFLTQGFGAAETWFEHAWGAEAQHRAAP